MARYAVVGLGRFGMTLVKLLAEAGEEVVAVDKDMDLIESVKELVSHAVCMDATDEKALREQGLDRVDALVAAIGENFEANQLVTILAKQFGVPKVITRVATSLQAQIMRLVGADEVICPEEESAQRLALHLINPNIVEHFALAPGHRVVEMRSPKNFVGKSIRELDIRRRFHVNLVAIKRVRQKGGRTIEEVENIPDPDYVIQADDTLVFVGKDKDIADMGK
ncbi:MAG: TrkA family potassium uptake protein [Planctomycetota bacterium]|nr:MAG: TrkA family potassium uptake protein [Planctomycetota bacterium]